LADLHIDDFCRDAALILLHLYSAFPRRASVYVEDICGPDTPDDVGLHSDRHMGCLGAMLWLAEENYLRFEAMIYQDGIDQAVLTGKTFTLLCGLSQIRYQQPPADLPQSVMVEKTTVVEQIRAVLRSGESSKISTMMRYFFSSQPQRIILPTAPVATLEKDSFCTDDS
jgi:hypothetical protein